MRRPSWASTKPTTQPSSGSPSPAWREVQRDRIGPSGSDSGRDYVATEEPLEVRVRGTAWAVLMRMPGREADLVAGFLAAEGVVGHSDDLVGVEACPDEDSQGTEPNVFNAVLAAGVPFEPEKARTIPVTSSCGLCGARTLEDLEKRLPGPPLLPESLEDSFLAKSFDTLRSRQEVFELTAGVHAAALVRPDGSFLDFAEDVGRHNAVDKVLGAQVLAGAYPLREPLVLLVSGRISFEIVQKAALARVGVVAGVSAPTSLAVESATQFGITLYGMVRGGSTNHYAGRSMASRA